MESNNQTSQTASFARLRSGAWAVRSMRPLQEGQIVKVEKKTGIVMDVNVGKFVEKAAWGYIYEIIPANIAGDLCA